MITQLSMDPIRDKSSIPPGMGRLPITFIIRIKENNSLNSGKARTAIESLRAIYSLGVIYVRCVIG